MTSTQQNCVKEVVDDTKLGGSVIIEEYQSSNSTLRTEVIERDKNQQYQVEAMHLKTNEMIFLYMLGVYQREVPY